MCLQTAVSILLLFYASCDAVLTFQFIENARARGALCNDGTQAGFYFTPGYGSGVNTWLIHQQGGWWCYDTTSCQQRLLWAPYYTTSLANSPTTTMQGVLSLNSSLNPTFYNANLVYVPYCSSDNWSGNRDPNGTNGIDGWYFKGKIIMKTVTEDLINMGMNSSDTQILLTGCSAGGNAVYNNVDYIISLLPFTPAKYLGFSDAGWIADFALNFIPPFATQYQYGIELWQGQPNQLCADANPSSSFMCYFGSSSLQYIKTPVITHIEQYDIIQFVYDCACNFNSTNPTMLSQMDMLRSSFNYSFLVVKPPHAVYSPACAFHCTSLLEEFTSISIGGVTLAQYLDKYWTDGGNGNLQSLVDTCAGFNCSPNCPAV